MRLLGVDFGFKRIGLAIAESDPGIISARPNLSASGKLRTDARQIADIAKKEEVALVILGLPVEESGEEGRMARICRALAGNLAELGIDVRLVDERMTSLQADSRLRDLGTGMKASGRRKLKDGEAARLILERYLSESGETYGSREPKPYDSSSL